MPSSLRVVGIGGAPRGGFDIEGKEADGAREDERFYFREGRGEEGEWAREDEGHTPVVCAAHTRRIRQRQYVLGRSPCQRHCRSRTGGAGERRRKKRRTTKREKIRLGINADLTVDDWSPPIVRR